MIRVRRREKLIDYRPYSQHILHERDGAFDFRYSAYLTIQRLLEKRRNEVYDMFLSPIKVSLQSLHSSNPSNSSIKVEFINCEMSDADRSQLLNRLLPTFHNSYNAVTTINIHSSANLNSCQRLLASLVIDLLSQPRVVYELKKVADYDYLREEIEMEDYLYHSEELLEGILGYLQSSLIAMAPVDGRQQQQPTGLTLVVVIGFLEGIAPSAFQQFIQTLKDLSFKVVIVTCCHPLCSSAYLENTAMCIDITVRRHASLVPSYTPFEMVDYMFDSLLTYNRNIPIHFSSSVLQSLTKNIGSTMICCQTLFQRLLLLYKAHFANNIEALLAMTNQWDWMKQMNLIKKKVAHKAAATTIVDGSSTVQGHNNNSNTGSSSSSSTGTTGGAEPLSFTELQDRLKLTFPQPLTNQHMEHAQEYISLSRMNFKLIKCLRDDCLPEKQRSRFPAIQLWPALFDRQFHPRKCKLLNSLESIVSIAMKGMPVYDLSILIEDMLHVLEPAKRLLTFTRAEFATYFTTVFNRTQEVEILVKAFLQQAKAKGIEDIEHYSVHTLKAKKEYEMSSVDIPSSLASSQQQQQQQQISLSSILEEIIQDFITWMKYLLDDFVALPWVMDGLEGICLFGKETEDCLAQQVHCDMRASLLKGLTEFSSNNEGTSSSSSASSSSAIMIPDVCRLGYKFVECEGVDAGVGWYESFCTGLGKRKAVGSNETQTNQPPARKRSKKAAVPAIMDTGKNQEATSSNNNQDNSTIRDDSIYRDVSLRCRFFSAIHDLEQAGLIKLAGNERSGLQIRKEVFIGFK